MHDQAIQLTPAACGKYNNGVIVAKANGFVLGIYYVEPGVTVGYYSENLSGNYKIIILKQADIRPMP